MTNALEHQSDATIVLLGDVDASNPGQKRETSMATLSVADGIVTLAMTQISATDGETHEHTEALVIDGKDLAELIMNHKDADRFAAYEKERMYLEGLLTTRINWYMTFVAFYLFAVFDNLSTIAASISLFLGALMSAAIAMSVSRTAGLVEEVLKGYRFYGSGRPYSKAYAVLKNGKWPRNRSANVTLATFPWFATAVFLILAIAIPSLSVMKIDGISTPPPTPNTSRESESSPVEDSTVAPLRSGTS